MIETRLGAARIAGVVGLAALALGPGLGGSGRLSYHEAIEAQAAREMVARGDPVEPTIGGRPWLERPPLAPWLIALSGWLSGGVSEASARAPSAVAAAAVALGVATLAARRFSSGTGLLAGCIQATTLWTVARGRLAESDILLAALVTWAFVALDWLRADPASRRWKAAFLGLLGATALAKGIGFGAVLVLTATAAVLAWDRDRAMLRALARPRGWALAGIVGGLWPLLTVVRHPSALWLWAMHYLDRLAAHPEHFASEPWWSYGPALLGQALPWTPLALLGAGPSLARAVRGRDLGAADRLLWAWAVAPVALLSLATVKNAHYIIHALPPWSIWAALGLGRLGAWLRSRGWSPTRIRRTAAATFAGLGLAYGLGFALLGPRLDRRGVEWAFYERAGRLLEPAEPLALLYDDWDRAPYPTPFGPVPHDLAVRLFYLDRPACWRQGIAALADAPPVPSPSAFAVIGRDRDLPGLRRLGHVEAVARGPDARPDRAYTLFRVTPEVAGRAGGAVRR